MGKVYYRHFAGTISGAPGRTSTISFDTALDAASDLKAIIIFAVDANAQNDASYSVNGNGPMESYGFTDLTNDFCADSSHRDEATGADLGDMSSSINSSLLHLYDSSTDATFAECSYASHTTSGFTVSWATQPSGSGTQITYTGYAICGPNVEAEARSDWISSTTRFGTDTITFSTLTSFEAVNIISVPDMATLGSRRLENCGVNRAWLNSNGDSNAVLEKHALETTGAIRTVQGGFDNGVVSGTSRTDGHWQWKRFYQVSGAISGSDLDLTIGGTNLTWGLRYMCLGLNLDGAATGQATNDTDTSTTFTPSPAVTNPGVIDGMVCGTMNTTGNVDSSYSHGWMGTVFDESDTSVGAFGIGSSSSANLTTKQNIASRTTPQNLPNSSSLYYRVSSNNPSEKHAYVSSVNNTTGEVTLAWTPSTDTVSGRHGVYFALGQQAASGGAAQIVTTTAITSGEAFGLPSFSTGVVDIQPTGTASDEGYGTATITTGPVGITTTGLASDEAFGTAAAQPGAVDLAPTGIASEESFGTATIEVEGVQIVAAGFIDGAEDFGTAAVQPGAVDLQPGGIASGEAFGAPTLTTGASTIVPSGLVSEEAFGAPNVVLGGVQVIAAGFIDGAEDFGTPTVTSGALDIATTGLPSEEAFGSATLTTGTVDIQPSGLASEAAFGSLTLISGASTIATTGIESVEAFGSPTLATGSVDLAPTGIASEEAFGTAEIFEGQTISVPGIVSEEAFGSATLDAGGIGIQPSGIESAEAFGTPDLDGLVVIGPGGISSAEAFGSASVDPTYGIEASGIEDPSAFGTAIVEKFLRIAPTGIPSEEAFGTAILGGGIPGVGVRLVLQAQFNAIEPISGRFDQIQALEGKYDAIQTMSASV